MPEDLKICCLALDKLIGTIGLAESFCSPHVRMATLVQMPESVTTYQYMPPQSHHSGKGFNIELVRPTASRNLMT